MSRRARLSGDLEIAKLEGGVGGDLIVAGSIRLIRDGMETSLLSPCEKYQHVQNDPAAVWTINHNLDTENPQIFVWNAESRVFARIDVISENQVAIYFATAQTGRAVVVKI